MYLNFYVVYWLRALQGYRGKVIVMYLMRNVTADAETNIQIPLLHRSVLYNRIYIVNFSFVRRPAKDLP